MTTERNELALAASKFVNNTASHIFLTGKAGTGKTTFLKSLADSTHKTYVVVAPTGIAALNAGGVTIHSMFQLPLGTFIPDRTPSGEFSESNLIYTQNTLARRHPLSGAKRQVLRAIDLLIIDEVSMLRADLLDAIDYRMRSVKGNYRQSFGGTQVLMIGDLYQLPPVVKDHELSYLRRYYNSAYFFESKVLQQEGFVYLELEKIYRQSDDRFIGLLNHFRDNAVTAQDIELLNSRYRTAEELRSEKDIVTITTHNYKADELNRNALDELKGQTYYYEAQIEGEFPENIYPINASLELKAGAQIMFIKNDVSGQNKYYNGLLAKVISLDEDEIIVEFATTHEQYKLSKQVWENKKYSVNELSKELDEDVVGTFQHYPVKLAWAITVHKSQGLTFDKAIIDVGQAFAPGQVYVALSRLKSLSGLFLRTRVMSDVISSDQHVVEFGKRKNLQSDLNELLRDRQNQYVYALISSTFQFDYLIQEIRKKEKSDSETTGEKENNSTPLLIATLLEREKQNLMKFRNQLFELLQNQNQPLLQERIEKGSAYFTGTVEESVMLISRHIEQVKLHKNQKGYLNDLNEIDQMLMKKWEELDKATHIIKSILNNEEPKNPAQLEASRREARNRILVKIRQEEIKAVPLVKSKTRTKKKSGKPDTVDASLDLWRISKDVVQVAKERNLVPGTVESHLAKAIKLGKLDITDVMEEDQIKEITKALHDNKELTTSEVHNSMDGKYSFGLIRCVQAHLSRIESNA